MIRRLVNIAFCIFAIGENVFATTEDLLLQHGYSSPLEVFTVKSFQNDTQEYKIRTEYLESYARWRYDRKTSGIAYDVSMSVWEMCEFGDPPVYEPYREPELPIEMTEKNSDTVLLESVRKRSKEYGTNEYEINSEYLLKFNEWRETCAYIFNNSIENYVKEYESIAWHGASGYGGYKPYPAYPKFPDEPQRPWWIPLKMW